MLYSIQACRAIAALLVVLFHSAGNLAKEQYFGAIAGPLEQTFWFGGQAGVAFFFVLSGFIINYVHSSDVGQPKTLLLYLRKRAIRIYPTYWIIFLSIFFLAWATPSLRGTLPSEIGIILKSLLLIPQDSKSVGGTGAPVIIVAWSLQYEIAFYACFALALIRKWLFYSLALVMALNLLLEQVLGPYSFPRSFFSNHLIVLFGMGILASMAIEWRVIPKHARWLAYLSVASFVMIAFIATNKRSEYQKALFDLAYGVVSAVIIFALARSEGHSKPNSYTKILGRLGDSSYALYLIHLPLVAILSKASIAVLPKSTFGVSCAFAILTFGSVAAGLLFNSLIERPLLRYLSRSRGV